MLLNRKMLSQIAIDDPAGFDGLVTLAGEAAGKAESAAAAA